MSSSILQKNELYYKTLSNELNFTPFKALFLSQSDENLGKSAERILCTIITLSFSTGIFTANNEYLIKQFHYNPKTLNKGFQHLHENYYLFRKSKSMRGGGSLRSYTTRFNFDKYVLKCLEEKNFDTAYEVLYFFETGYSLNPKGYDPNTLDIILYLRNKVSEAESFHAFSSSSRLPTLYKKDGMVKKGIHGMVKTTMPVIIYNTNNKKKNNKDDPTVLPSVVSLHQEEKFEGYTFFLKTLQADQVILVEKYVQYFPERLSKVIKKAAYIKRGLLNGWLLQDITNYELEQEEKEEKEKIEVLKTEKFEENKKYAEEFIPIFQNIKPLDEKQREVTFSGNNSYALTLEFSTQEGRKSCRNIAYSDPQFREEFDKYVDLLKRFMQKKELRK